jgi:NAD(P)-dependent dehydrogenase (short-subunit alcohol dehydrogenase family)
MVSSKYDPRKDSVDLKGKVVIVTGGKCVLYFLSLVRFVWQEPLLISRGIGYATVQHLAQAGAKVYMATRNEEKAKEAIEGLKKSGIEPGEVVYLKLDLEDPKQVKQAAEEFASKETRLDVLGMSHILRLSAKGLKPFYDLVNNAAV